MEGYKPCEGKKSNILKRPAAYNLCLDRGEEFWQLDKMNMGLLKKILNVGTPVVRTAEDLLDPRAREIALKNLIRISDIPNLYSGLKEGKINIEYGQLIGSLPQEYNQILAHALICYELTKRKKLQILIESEISQSFLGEIEISHVGIIKRNASVEEYENLARAYMRNAEILYGAYERANLLKS